MTFSNPSTSILIKSSFTRFADPRCSPVGSVDMETKCAVPVSQSNLLHVGTALELRHILAEQIDDAWLWLDATDRAALHVGEKQADT